MPKSIAHSPKFTELNESFDLRKFAAMVNRIESILSEYYSLSPINTEPGPVVLKLKVVAFLNYSFALMQVFFERPGFFLGIEL